MVPGCPHPCCSRPVRHRHRRLRIPPPPSTPPAPGLCRSSSVRASCPLLPVRCRRCYPALFAPLLIAFSSSWLCRFHAPLLAPTAPVECLCLLPAREREHLPRSHHARAYDARHVIEFAHDDREVARGEWQRPLVDGASHLGQKRVTYARNPAADHDHRRVEHINGRGQSLADQPPRPADCRQGAVVATPGGFPDIFHGELALLLQERHEGR